jgi:hypothetical protein
MPPTKTTSIRSTNASEAMILVTEAINTLNSRIEKTESDFVGHLQKVEDRLDQIVDLTKTVAVLQQHSSHNTDQITEMRNSMRESGQKMDVSISRIHTRLDEISNAQRDRMELHTKDSDMKLSSLDSKFASALDIVRAKMETENTITKSTIMGDLKTVKEKADNTESEFKKWFNRGWGMWVVASLIFLTAQTVAFRWLESNEQEKVQLIQKVNDTTTIVDKHSTQLESTQKTLTDIGTSVRRVEQMSMDNERQMEYLRSQISNRK